MVVWWRFNLTMCFLLGVSFLVVGNDIQSKFDTGFQAARCSFVLEQVIGLRIRNSQSSD